MLTRATAQAAANAVARRLGAWARLCRLDRPIGIWLLLWPTLWALWIAGEGRPPQAVTLVFIAGVVLMRSAGCAINDWADRRIDPGVRRTRERPLARGEIRPWEALAVFAALALAAYALVSRLDPFTVKLAWGGLLLAAAYPFAKRYTYLPQVVLGAAFGWAIPMAFAAVQGALPPIAWLLYTTALLWTTAYDTLYAMADREDDLRLGVKSTAILFGRADVAMVGLLYLLTLLGLVLVGLRLRLSAVYGWALAAAAAHAAYQLWLARDRRPEHCLLAFQRSHVFGLLVFLGLAGHYLWHGPCAAG